MGETTFQTVQCPKCNRTLQIPVDAQRLVCMYCAQPFDARVLLETVGEDPERLLDEVKATFPPEVFREPFKLNGFNAQDYPVRFRTFADRIAPALHAYLRAAAADRQTACEQIGGWMLEQYCAAVQAAGITREGDQRLFEYRYAVVALMVPALIEFGPETEALADTLLVQWNTRYPKNPLGKCSFQEMNAGFNKRMCYITTAVCQSFGLPDDCYPLEQFRAFRDSWLKASPDGGQKITEYYLFAPAILRAIAQCGHSGSIYREIWERHLRPCLHALETDQSAVCAARYEGMVRALEREFLVQS